MRDLASAPARYRTACLNAADVQVQSRMSIRPARRTAFASQASAEVPRRQALSAAAGAALLLFSGLFHLHFIAEALSCCCGFRDKHVLPTAWLKAGYCWMPDMLSCAPPDAAVHSKSSTCKRMTTCVSRCVLILCRCGSGKGCCPIPGFHQAWWQLNRGLNERIRHGGWAPMARFT